jgi:hypothetical protein
MHREFEGIRIVHNLHLYMDAPRQSVVIARDFLGDAIRLDAITKNNLALVLSHFNFKYAEFGGSHQDDYPTMQCYSPFWSMQSDYWVGALSLQVTADGHSNDYNFHSLPDWDLMHSPVGVASFYRSAIDYYCGDHCDAFIPLPPAPSAIDFAHSLL